MRRTPESFSQTVPFELIFFFYFLFSCSRWRSFNFVECSILSIPALRILFFHLMSFFFVFYLLLSYSSIFTFVLVSLVYLISFEINSTSFFILLYMVSTYLFCTLYIKYMYYREKWVASYKENESRNKIPIAVGCV